MAIGARVAQPFGGTLAARDFIDLNGNNIQSDSFDSASPLYSTAGQYDPAKRRDHGDVAAYFGLTNSLNVGNAKIYGVLWTGPRFSARIGPQGAVGSIAYVDTPSNNGTIQSGWFRDDMDPFFPDVTLPSLAGGFVPPAGVVGGTNYTYVLGSDNYRLSNLSMGGSQTMLVTGRATLWVQGSITISGNSKIVVSPSGILILYAGTAAGTNTTASIGGGGIVNQTYRALGFQYYGLPTHTSMNLTGNGNFVGTIYAPNAGLTLNGGGASDEDFSGATIARTVIT